jgi:CRP/FNR family cyclic AMP-dependent transcriptional regulator
MDVPLGYLFEGLTDDQLKKIVALAAEIAMEDGQKICKEGEEAEALFILKTGAVELLTTIDAEVELPIAMLRKPGKIFGAGALVAPYQYALTARCAETGTLLSIERSVLQKLLNGDRDLGFIVMTNLAEHFLGKLKESRQELKIHFNTLLKSFR